MSHVSIIVPTVNAPCFEECVRLLRAHSDVQFELLVVCDAPTPEKRALLARLEAEGALSVRAEMGSIRVIINEERLGLTRAMNRAWGETHGKYIAMVSDDIFVGPGWLSPLVQALEAHPEFGYVTPIVDRASNNTHFYFGAIGEGSLHTREMIEKTGGYDEGEEFQKQNGDDEWYVRIRRAGFTPHGVVESRVRHLVGQTVGTELDPWYLTAPMEELRRRYGQEAFSNKHRIPAWSVKESRDLPWKPLLYITADDIGTETGGGVVTREELRALQGLGAPDVLSRKSIQTPGLPDSPFIQDYAMLWNIQHLMREAKPHLAQFYAGIFSQTVRYLRACDVPVAYTVAAHNRRTTMEEFGRLGMQYPWQHVKDPMQWAMHKQGYLDADLLIAPSTHSAEFLLSEGARDVLVIPHGCELPKEVAPMPARFSAGYLGQVGPDKGLVYLLRGWKSSYLSDKLSGVLRIGGQNTRQALFPICDRERIKGAEILDWVQDKAAFYSSLSVYCQPSVTEGFSITTLEAMAHGRPVIVTQGVGAKDLVQEGLNGFVVPIRDPGAIAERLEWCRQHPEELLRMGRAARATAELYTWGRVGEEYRKAWQKVMR